ncbi:MAG: AAA family ATPase, partial [Thermomicrobiales bacterium]
MAISHKAGPALQILPAPPVPTNLTFGRPRRASVSRAALVDRLAAGTSGKATIIVAPAGWGKTSLLAEWMASTSRTVAWLPLEARDNDRARALRLLAMAMNQAVPGLADDVLAALRTSYLPSIEDIVALLIDAMRSTGANFVQVIDDLQHLNDPELLRGLQALVAEAPDSVSFVLSGRTDPPFNLSRWRVQGDVTDIRIDDLRFSTDEATTLFGQDRESGFDRNAVEQIVARTEGWAAGIRIAALTLRGNAGDAADFPMIHGTQREIAGFLCEEVFSCQPAEMQEFLLQVSVFEKISGPFGDAVLGRSDTQLLLERATEANLFMVPCNCSQNMYRIHQLFRDYLLAELQRRHPMAANELHRRAADWLIGNDQPMDAIDHLIAAGETGASIDLIDRISTNMVLTSEHTSTFLKWVERFPRDIVVAKPRMLRFYVQALTLTGRLSDAESLTNAMEAHPFYHTQSDGESNDRRRAEILAVRSRIAAYRGDNERTVALADAALEKLGTHDLAWQASLQLDLGWAWRALGQLDESAVHLAQASRLGWESGNLQPALWGTR